jgi:hypothetical protein
VTSYYVYYKVEEGKDLRPFVQRILEAVESETRIQGRWLRRRDDPSTYMEVYEDVKDDEAFEALLARLSGDFPVPRRVEIFRMANHG